MTNLSFIPDPTAEQLLQDYRVYCDHPLPLYNPVPDGDGDGGTARLMPRSYSRFVEGDLIPVIDHATQQLAKRCADLHDQILASATIDTGNATGEDNKEVDKGAKNGDGTGGSSSNNEDRNKNNGGNDKNNDPKNMNNTTTPAAAQILHIPYPLFLEFAALFNQLTQPSPGLSSSDSNLGPAENPSNDSQNDPETLHIPADELMPLVSSQAWRAAGHMNNPIDAEKRDA